MNDNRMYRMYVKKECILRRWEEIKERLEAWFEFVPQGMSRDSGELIVARRFSRYRYDDARWRMDKQGEWVMVWRNGLSDWDWEKLVEIFKGECKTWERD